VGRRVGRVRRRLTFTRQRVVANSQRLLAVPDGVLVVVAIVVPLAFVMLRSWARVDPVTLEVKQVWTWDAYRTMFSPTYRPVLLRSAWLALLTMAMCVAVGTPTALALSRLRGQWRTIAVVVVLLPSFVNFTVRIFAWQGLLANGGPVNSLFGVRWLYQPPAVAVGMLTAYVPLYVLPVLAALNRSQPEVLEAAADLGAAPWRTLWTVTLPMARVGIATGVGVVGVLSLGEFVVPTLLGGGRVMLVGNLLAERGAGRDQPLAGALTAVLLLTLGTGAVALTAIRRRLTRGDTP
jgi:ABC-type spermidine/putrescine transport system permease subunit I